ncbi:hypothetical protein OBBRIDRAFT_180517 [Obba rivulosa]|uniref:Uncharacterized protein n=1 Tax=Obba rivulosa TaxID=1052685 RepID=A0A8E2J409_9APHY|nr:hypothetical protein OBBRIDRAFT_180517 [Obba rivulosa]
MLKAASRSLARVSLRPPRSYHRHAMSQGQRPLSPSQNAQVEEASRSEKRPRLASSNASPSELADAAVVPTPLASELEDQSELQPAVKAAAPQKPAKRYKNKIKHSLPEPYTAEYVVAREVSELLGQETVDKAVRSGTEWDSPFQFKEEVTLTVSRISSTGMFYTFAPHCPLLSASEMKRVLA